MAAFQKKVVWHQCKKIDWFMADTPLTSIGSGTRITLLERKMAVRPLLGCARRIFSMKYFLSGVKNGARNQTVVKRKCASIVSMNCKVFCSQLIGVIPQSSDQRNPPLVEGSVQKCH